MFKKSDYDTQLVTEIPEQQKVMAKKIKENLSKSLKQFDDALKVIYDFKDAVVADRPDRKALKDNFGRIIRYRRKIINVFNKFFLNLKPVLEQLSTLKDPETVRLRNLIISAFDEISNTVESLTEIMEEVDRENFTKRLEAITTQLENRRQSINDVIDNQLFNHLEKDFLGKMKISSVRANIYKRKRKIKRIFMER